MSSDHRQPDNLPHTLPEPVEYKDLDKWHLAPMKDYVPPKIVQGPQMPVTYVGPGAEELNRKERERVDAVNRQRGFDPGGRKVDPIIRDMHRAEGLRAARTNLVGCRYDSVQEQLHSTALPPEVERALFDLIAVTNHHLSHLSVRPPLDYERQAEEAMAVIADELLTALEERTRRRLERQAEEYARRMEHDKLDLPHMTTDEAVLRQYSGAFVVEPKEEPPQ